MSAGGRAYGQFCGLAVALDLLGERWTLLVVRELLIGPARFRDLAEAMPGMSPAMLSQRVQTLQEAGVIESRTPASDGRARIYSLTEVGEGLRPTVLHLAKWGLNFLSSAEEGTTRAAWGFLAIQAMIVDRPVPAVDESYEFRIADEVFHIAVDGGKVTAARGDAAEEPALVIRTDVLTFMKIGGQLINPLEAMMGGALTIDGDPAALRRCLALTGLAGAEIPAA